MLTSIVPRDVFFVYVTVCTGDQTIISHLRNHKIVNVYYRGRKLTRKIPLVEFNVIEYFTQTKNMLFADFYYVELLHKVSAVE